MQRLNCTKILNGAKIKAVEQIQICNYEKTNKPYPKWEFKETNYLGQEIDNKFGWSRKLEKYKFIYTVINNNIYYTHEGEVLKITDKEIQQTFNLYVRLIEVIESFSHRDDFTHYLFHEAKNSLAEEEQEVNEYNELGALRKLLNNDATLDLQLKEIGKTRQIIVRLNDEMKEAIAHWKAHKITGSELDTIRNKKDEYIQYYTSKLEYLSNKYKNTSEKTKYRRRKLLKACFNSTELYSIEFIKNPTLLMKNISSCEFIIRQYCKWFNEVKFDIEIAINNRIKKNEDKKIKRAQKKSNRELESERRTQILSSYIKSNLSLSAIAKETNISKSAIQRILNKLRNN